MAVDEGISSTLRKDKLSRKGSLPAALSTSQGTTRSSDADDSTAVRERVETARKRRRRSSRAICKGRNAAIQTERIFSAALPEPFDELKINRAVLTLQSAVKCVRVSTKNLPIQLRRAHGSQAMLKISLSSAIA